MNIQRDGKGSGEVSPVTKQRVVALIITTGFAGILWFLCKTKLISAPLVYFYAGMSIIAVIVYAKDKLAAKRGTWRTPEITLHAIALFGGWPGAMLAQNFLRHKSNKLSFRIIYWVTIVVNCGVLWWLVMPNGNT